MILQGCFQLRTLYALEEKLVAFNDSTSTQIAIVTVSDLKGYDKADYAQRLAEKWGIGQKGLDNGMLILVKPKTNESSGQVQIAQGYGLEGAIPDIICGQIVDYEIFPEFRNGNYYEGLDKATSTLMSLASGEYPADQYGKSKGKRSGQYCSDNHFYNIPYNCHVHAQQRRIEPEAYQPEGTAFVVAAVDDEFRR